MTDPFASARLRTGTWTLVALAALTLLLLNRNSYPVPWFDEGMFTSLAATLSRTGYYTATGGRGFMTEGAGPSVIAPVAVAIHVLGESLPVARLPALVFGLVGLVLYASIARRMFGFGAAVIATLLLLSGSRELYVSYVYLARQVIGEIPALTFYLAGLLCLIVSIDKQDEATGLTVVGGLCWTGATLAKPHFVPTLALATALIIAADSLYYRTGLNRRMLRFGIAAGGAWALLFVLQGPRQGVAQVIDNLHGLVGTARVVGMTAASAHWRLALGALWRSGFLITGVPGLLWALSRARARTRDGAWGGWYVALSLGWARYAFPLHALALMWTAGWFVHAANASSQRFTGPPVRIGLASALVALMAYNVTPLLRGTLNPPFTGYDEARAGLAALPPGARIATWEWQMDLGSHHPLMHPDYEIILAYIDRMMAGLPTDDAPKAKADSEYLMVGPFGSWTGYYANVIAGKSPVFRAGDYQLFKLDAQQPEGEHAPGNE